MTVLELFRSGMDTYRISAYLFVHGCVADEAFVYNEIHRLREAERAAKASASIERRRESYIRNSDALREIRARRPV
jgi:hypothetical protein